jgi:hypothetical protein
MKYYIYISDTKVDMLFAQIPQSILKKISGELNINLGMVSVSLKEKQNEQTRFDKVNVVSNYINEHLDVGDVDHPKAYFKETVSTRWGPLFGGDTENLVFFAGKTHQTIFGLGGSSQHVMGQQKGQSPGPNSFTPSILASLKKLDIHSDFGALSDDIASHSDPLRLVSDAAAWLEGPEEKLEFLAKKLVEGSLNSKHILLGSPIYVAYAD